MKNELSRKHRVLIVDDMTQNIKVLSNMLIEEELDVRIAMSGAQALQMTDVNLPDLILLDINMPEMDGFETCRRLKTDPIKKDIPIIFLTGYSDTDYKTKAFSLGGVDYITKPFKREEVIARVKTHLEIGTYRKFLEDEVQKRTLELEIINRQLQVEMIKARQAEENLIQAQKMETVGTLAGGLAHDFNNILGGITGPLSIVKFKLKNQGEIDKQVLEGYIDTIEQSSARAVNMVKHLLTLSRKHELTLVPVDLNLTVRHVMKIAESSFDKSVELDPQYAPLPPMINADPTQIEQVLLNFCVNAVHSMTIMRENNSDWGGKLSISIKKIKSDIYFKSAHPDAKDMEYWTLSVKDTGVGIRKEIIGKIFDPFFTTKLEGQGTGLGLAMVYNIVKQHDGLVDVYSEPGLGTLFNIYFPVLKLDDKLTSDMESSRNVYHGTGHILIIDDEAIMRQIGKEILEECGYEVLLAEDGEAGIRKYRSRNDDIQAVLLDMNMPGLSSRETFMEIKKINPDVKVLLCSGFIQDDHISEIIELGASGFIQKPFTLVPLATNIRKMFEPRKS